MLLVKILSAIALMASSAWFINKPGYDSAIAAITALSALIGCYLIKQKESKKQEQKIKNGIGIQAGKSITINNSNISGDKDHV